ncbi:hypothetical protein ACQ4M3_17775 [Leptolyngbya sp. AN03gr2]|uniref:hypothetical protein n=1 Tax=unclassified Leptolyngbya TaxID=2650499 RepID=UPI003D3121A2
MSRRNTPNPVNQGALIAFASNIVAAAIYYLITVVLLQSKLVYSPSLPWAKQLFNLCMLLFWGIGFSQIIHLLPISLWLRRQRQSETLKGLMIGAITTCLLCGGCFVIFSQAVFYYLLMR